VTVLRVTGEPALSKCPSKSTTSWPGSTFSSSAGHQVLSSSPYLLPSIQTLTINPGIGYAVAEACLESSAHVTISSSNQSRVTSSLKTLKEAYPSSESKVFGHACDLSNPTLEKDIEKLLEACGKVDHMYLSLLIFHAIT